ncbi:hypothetical protein PTKIN_Ptkin02bG0045700 [Pterospermum kingtungense]
MLLVTKKRANGDGHNLDFMKLFSISSMNKSLEFYALEFLDDEVIVTLSEDVLNEGKDLWNTVGGSIHCAIGNPLYIDNFTVEKKKLAYAKVCVEIDVVRKIPKYITVVLVAKGVTKPSTVATMMDNIKAQLRDSLARRKHEVDKRKVVLVDDVKIQDEIFSIQGQINVGHVEIDGKNVQVQDKGCSNNGKVQDEAVNHGDKSMDMSGGSDSDI